jgi:hypothetical protein
MRPRLIVLTFLFSATAMLCTSALAQTALAHTFFVPMPTGGCPVHLFTHQQGDPATVWITSFEDARNAEPNSQHSGLHVDLNAATKAIKQVELAVSFLPPGTRVLPIAGQYRAERTPAPEAKKTFTIAAKNSASLQLAADLLIGPAAAITRVKLLRVDYADGTAWQANTCSVEPSRLLRIDTH